MYAGKYRMWRIKSATPLNDYERHQEPTAGHMFSVDLEVGGYKTNIFRTT